MTKKYAEVITAPVPPSIKSALLKEADETDLNVAILVRRALKQYVERQESAS